MAGYQTPWNQTAMYRMAMNQGTNFLNPNETYQQRWFRERKAAMDARKAEQDANQRDFLNATYENQSSFDQWKAGRDMQRVWGPEGGQTRRVPAYTSSNLGGKWGGPRLIGHRDVRQRDVSQGDPATGGYGGQGPGGFNEWSENRDDYRKAQAAGDFKNMSPSQREEARMDMSAFREEQAEQRYKKQQEMIAAKEKQMREAAEDKEDKESAYDEASAPSGPSDASALSPTPGGRAVEGGEEWHREGDSNYAPSWWDEYKKSGHDAPITEPDMPTNMSREVRRELDRIRKESRPKTTLADLYTEFGGDPKNRITDRADDGSADNFEGAYAADSGGHDSDQPDDNSRLFRDIPEDRRAMNAADPQAPDTDLGVPKAEDWKEQEDKDYREKIGTATDKVKAAGDAGHLPPEVVAGLISQLQSGRPSAVRDAMWRLNEMGVRKGWIDPPPLHEDSLQRRPDGPFAGWRGNPFSSMFGSPGALGEGRTTKAPPR